MEFVDNHIGKNGAFFDGQLCHNNATFGRVLQKNVGIKDGQMFIKDKGEY